MKTVLARTNAKFIIARKSGSGVFSDLYFMHTSEVDGWTRDISGATQMGLEAVTDILEDLKTDYHGLWIIPVGED